VTGVLVVLVVPDACGARPEADAQPDSPAANKPTQATPRAMPSDMVLVAMTPIGLLVGNYPFVTSRVLERALPATTPVGEASLGFQTISSEHAFGELRTGWDLLVRAMARPSPFLLHGWLTEWWRHYGDGCSLAVQAAFRGHRLVGALPLITYSRHGLTVATFIGGRQSAPADVLLATDEDPAVAAMLADRAASSHDYADLFGLPGDCRLAAVCDRSPLQLFQRIEAPVLDMDQGWEAVYRAKTNGKKRAYHRRRRRQLAELGKVEV